MSEHRSIHETSLSPPRPARVARAERRPGVLHRLAPVTVFAGTVVMIALAILSALTLLAATPAGFAVPTTLLLIGVLVAAALAARTRDVLRVTAPAATSRSRSTSAEASGRAFRGYPPSRDARGSRSTIPAPSASPGWARP